MVQADILINPFDPAFRIDPYPTYQRLRTEDPVHHSPFGLWIVSRYDDCLAIAKNPNASSDEKNATSHADLVEQVGFDPIEQAFGGAPFLFLDAPDHTRLRALVSKAFTPRVVEGLRSRVQEIVDGLLRSVTEQGTLDVVADLAYPLPVTVISELLGVPPEDHETFKGWSADLARSLDPVQVVSKEAFDAQLETFHTFGDYFRGLISERRKSPRDDLLSALIAAEEQGERLTEDEIVVTCVLLLVAGHETTVNLIGNGALALLQYPNQLAMLRDDPSLVVSAVEEFLRYDPPVQGTQRIMLDEIEVDGTAIPKGEQAILLLAAANRDPEQFREPDQLDITRKDNQHLSFGLMSHYCLGAPLARLEGQIALGTLVRRFADLRLQTETLDYKENIVLRGLRSLPVGFS